MNIISITICILGLTIYGAHGDPSRCLLPKDPGPCKGYCPRWYYDVTDGKCKSFVYGCCQGNANNFQSKKKCNKACKGVDICLLPKDIGPCEGLCKKWYYNKMTQECEPFDWGCCQGNANRFDTAEECKKRCNKPVEKPHCYLPADIGPCDGLCTRWYYDAKVKKCKTFDYGCCGGNKNNFETKKQCKRSCKGADVCKLPKDIGPCDGLCPSWYYNYQIKQCLPFDWGCCPGNDNNFESKMKCENQCK